MEKINVGFIGLGMVGQAIYDILSETPFLKLSVNTEEDCIISCCEPPYLEIELVCGHNISLVTLVGLICEHEYTYRLTCPMCRCDIEFKWIDGIVFPKSTDMLMGECAMSTIKDIINTNNNNYNNNNNEDESTYY